MSRDFGAHAHWSELIQILEGIVFVTGVKSLKKVMDSRGGKKKGSSPQEKNIQVVVRCR